MSTMKQWLNKEYEKWKAAQYLYLGYEFLTIALQNGDQKEARTICANFHPEPTTSEEDIILLAKLITSCANRKTMITILKNEKVLGSYPNFVLHLAHYFSGRAELLPLLFYYVPTSVWQKALLKEDIDRIKWRLIEGLLYSYGLMPKLVITRPLSHVDIFINRREFVPTLLCIRLVNVAMAFHPLSLPPYVLLQIIECLPDFDDSRKFGHKQRIERVVRICEFTRP